MPQQSVRPFINHFVLTIFSISFGVFIMICCCVDVAFAAATALATVADVVATVVIVLLLLMLVLCCCCCFFAVAFDFMFDLNFCRCTLSSPCNARSTTRPRK